MPLVRDIGGGVHGFWIWLADELGTPTRAKGGGSRVTAIAYSYFGNIHSGRNCKLCKTKPREGLCCL